MYGGYGDYYFDGVSEEATQPVADVIDGGYGYDTAYVDVLDDLNDQLRGDHPRVVHST